MKTIGLLGGTGWSSTIGYYKILNELVADHLNTAGKKKVLLLATKFTMEDGFFSKILEDNGIQVEIPNEHERNKMQEIHNELMHNVVIQESRDYFSNLITSHKDLDAVILGCTEYPLVVDHDNSILPIVDPVYLQAITAVNYALDY